MRHPLTFVFGLAASSILLIVSIVFALETSVLYAALLFTYSLIAFLVLHNHFVKEKTPRYPLSFPGERDAYFPFSNIPRPIHDDVNNYPEYFKHVEEEKEPNTR